MVMKEGTLPGSIFDSRSTNFSLDTKLLDDMLHRAKVGETLSPSPEKYMLRALAFFALKQCGRDYEKLKHSWLAKLLPEGCVMIKRCDKESNRETTGAWVLSTSEWGALTWNVKLKQSTSVNDWWYILPAPTSTMPWRQQQVWDWREVWVCLVEVMPPTLLHRNGIRCDGIQLKLEKRKPIPLMMAAAQEAFKGLTCPEMTDLIRIARVGYTGRRPTLEKELAELLVRWALPEASDEEVQRILRQRGQSRSRHEAVLSEEHEEAVKELADEDEQQSISKTLKSKDSAKQKPDHVEDTANKDFSSRKDVQALADPPPEGPAEGSAGHETPRADTHDPPPEGPAEESAGHESPRADGHEASGHGVAVEVGGSSGSSGASKRRLLDIENREYSAADARVLLPSAMGCTISINKNERWQVKYDGRLAPPRSWSQCWQNDVNGMSYMDVLRRAIAWAWLCHQETHPGSDCPFDLTGVDI
jgi:hypothetical protein